MTFRDGPQDGEVWEGADFREMEFGGPEFGGTGAEPGDTESGDSADQSVQGQLVQGQPVQSQPVRNQAAQAQTVRLMVRLTPASSLPGFHARVSGGRLGAPMEFSDAAAFVRFLERIAERGPGLK